MINEAKKRAELADFLRTRRARLHPEQFGLPSVGRRRTPGLRRDEVAQLAGVGVSWYSWLEQGRAITVSDHVLESLARVLQLDVEERRHLFLLARGMVPVTSDNLEATLFPASLQAILDALGTNPAYLIDQRCNVLAWNTSACRVFGDFSRLTGRDRNFTWSLFTRPEQRAFFVRWDLAAHRAVMSLRSTYDQYAGDPWFEQFITDLKHASPEFNALWSQHDVKWSCDPNYKKELNHPQVGYLLLSGATLIAPDAPTLRMVIFTPCSQDTAAKLTTLGETEHSHALTR